MNDSIRFPLKRYYHIAISLKIKGVSFDFRNDGILLTPSFTMSDYHVLEALDLALRIHPFIITTETFRMNVENLSWKQITDDQIEAYLEEAMPYYTKLIMSLPFEICDFIQGILVEVEQRRKRKALTASIYSLKPPTKQLRDRPGHVYLIRSSSGYYKIGRSKDPNDRMATFGVKLPFEVEYDHLIQCGDMYAVESELHQKFVLKRKNGEWFDLDEYDVEWIKSIGPVVGRWIGEKPILDQEDLP